MGVHHGVCVEVRGPLWVFLSTLWFLGLKLRSSRLVVDAFTYRTILLALDRFYTVIFMECLIADICLGSFNV